MRTFGSIAGRDVDDNIADRLLLCSTQGTVERFGFYDPSVLCPALVGREVEMEKLRARILEHGRRFGATALTPETAPTIRRLADLEPRTLALMHGPAYAGDRGQALLDLADVYHARFAASLDFVHAGTV